MTAATTTSRLLGLLSLLQVRRDWPGPELATRLGVSHRTVRRDVDRLRDLGYHIVATMGPDGGYRLEAGRDLPPLVFDDDQAIALALALQAASQTGAGIEEAALRALTTIRQVMPARLRHRLAVLEFSTMTRPGDARPPLVSPDVLIAISSAIRACDELRFDYVVPETRPESGARPPRRVEPHHLVAAQGRWYLVAWDLARDDWRIFRADRIRPRSPAGPRFTPREIPGGRAGEFVAARLKGSPQDNAWPCIGTVILGLSAEAVLPFAGDGTVEAVGPDRCRFTAGSWSWIALAASLNAFDTAIEVVGPVELKVAFADLAARNAATARGGSGPESG
ncbi:MAG TPA: WYL domain-containing protein [Thermomicrobiales bacterium]|nr:WYL domain-containing protein [Thermomicrobiales bacterium]